ncbi:MAG TPA: class I SAM-dependent methyltransferase [Anaerolineales bacterium]|nr:class I SAM-dependent methyltransferase [Anaerolineales bacterium]
MDSNTAERLLELNRQFYTEHGRDFSETRGRLQPGVLRVLDSLRGDEAILDLGCGNGELARTLSKRGHRGSYLGLDFSLPLLHEAEREAFSFPVEFKQADLAQLSAFSFQLSVTSHWSFITAFAMLHHIPTAELRLNIMKGVHELLGENSRFIHSNWQFLSSPRLKARIQPWSTIGLTAQDVDVNDYLLDWKRGGGGLRYVHHFDETELSELAKASGFEITETFYSDGETKRSSLYQLWNKQYTP